MIDQVNFLIITHFIWTAALPIQQYDPNFPAPYGALGVIEELPPGEMFGLTGLPLLPLMKPEKLKYHEYYQYRSPMRNYYSYTGPDFFNPHPGPNSEFDRLLLSYLKLKDYEDYRPKFASYLPIQQTSRPRRKKKIQHGQFESKKPEIENPQQEEFKEVTPNQKVDNFKDNNENQNSTEPSRRTFSFIIPAVQLGLKMLDADLGLGLTMDDTFETKSSSTNQQEKNEWKVLQQANEQMTLEQLKTQATLQQLKADSEMISKSSQAEIEALKSKIEKLSELTEQDRREKAELKARLEFEAMMRERDSQELARQLEVEASKREIEKKKIQNELLLEAAKAERERLALSNKLNAEAQLQELRTLKSSENFNTKMDSTFTSQYHVRDYRTPTSIGPTVGFV